MKGIIKSADLIKQNPSCMYYIYQVDGGLVGVGHTLKLAIEDAYEFVDQKNISLEQLTNQIIENKSEAGKMCVTKNRRFIVRWYINNDIEFLEDCEKKAIKN